MTIADIDTYVTAQGPKIYADKLSNAGGETNYDLNTSAHALARLWADAHVSAEVQWYIEKVAEQVSPDKADLLIGQLEWEYGVIPAPGATIDDRRDELAWMARASGGASRANVEAVLTEALGADFVAFVTTPFADSVQSSDEPTAFTTGSYSRMHGQWDAPDSPPGVFQLVTGSDRVIVSAVPQARNIRLKPVAGDAQISNGQRVMFDTANHFRAESLTVTVLADPAHNTAHPGEYLLEAHPWQPHSAGTFAQVGRVPNLSSTKRDNYVVLTADAAVDGPKRDKVNRVMRRLMRGVSTWTVCAETSPGSGTSGPFVPGTGIPGVTPIREIEF